MLFDPTIEEVRAKIGRDARPTGFLRVLVMPDNSERMQYHWTGYFGELWIDVPSVPFSYAYPGGRQ